MPDDAPAEYGAYVRHRRARAAASAQASNQPAARLQAWLMSVPRIDSMIDSDRAMAIARMPDIDLPSDPYVYGRPTLYGDVPVFLGADRTRVRSHDYTCTASEAVALGMMPPEMVYLASNVYQLVHYPVPLLRDRSAFVASARAQARVVRAALAARTRTAIEAGQPVCLYDLVAVGDDAAPTYLPVWLAIDLQHLPQTVRLISNVRFGLAR